MLADHCSLRLVLLNSCKGARGSERDIFSSTAPILVRRGVPSVLAMQYEITDRAAIEFSRSFYEALADGMAVDAAVAEARKAISLSVTNTVEWGTPVLYMRSPDGVLFKVQDTEAARRAREEAKHLERERRERVAREKAEPVLRERAATRLLGLPPLFWVVLVALLGFSSVLVGPKIWSILRPPSTPTWVPTHTPTATATVTPTSIRTLTPTPAEPQAGATQVLEPAGIVVVYVPAGEFLIGSSDSDPDADADEKPPHTVYLDRYWTGRTEVTNAQFGKFIEAGGYSKRDYWTDEAWEWKERKGAIEPYYWKDEKWNQPQLPVVGVSWYEAAAYAKWLGARLPTEAEWEKAARGTDGRRWPWDNELSGGKANTIEGGIDGTMPVGSYPDGASPYGCLDMAGNVWEWVADWYSVNYYADSPDSNPTGPASGDSRVLRGGSWRFAQHVARCAYRGGNHPDLRSRNVGFRVAE